MSALRAAALGAWEFVVGDDWRTAAGVVLALGLVAALAGAGLGAWWVMPPALLALLASSLRRELSAAAGARRARRVGPQRHSTR